MWDPVREKRVKKTIPIRLPLEALDHEFKLDPRAMRYADQDPDDRIFESYLTHPVTEKYGRQAVTPLRIYTDGVPVGKTDNFVRFSISSAWSHKRRTVFVVMKSTLCKCGCNGHCTLNALQWPDNKSINALQKGVHPEARHDESPWLPSDSQRSQQRGSLSWIGAVCEIAGTGPNCVL